MSQAYLTDVGKASWLDWIIENEAFMLKRHGGKSCVFISGNVDGCQRIGDFCESPYDALRSAMSQIIKDKDE